MSVQKSKINVVSPTSSSENPEVGIEALTWVVREVLKKVVVASLERNKELVQSRGVDCG